MTLTADRAQLAHDHHRLVFRVASRYRNACRPGIELEDLAAEGAFGLLAAAAAFDPSRGTRFTSYAWRAIDNRIRDHLRDLRRRKPEVSLCPADALAPDATEDTDEAAAFVVNALATLRPEDAELLRRRFGIGQPAQSFDQIAPWLGVSKVTARQRAVRALDRLRRKVGASV